VKASGVMSKITVKVYNRGPDVLVAACDKDILGRTLREGELKLEVSEDFYQGEDADEEMLINRLEMATVANLVGDSTCEIAAKHDFISLDCVIRISGVPHAQMVKW
jgi:hypothetical protein